MEISTDTYFKLCNKCKKLLFEDVINKSVDVDHEKS